MGLDKDRLEPDNGTDSQDHVAGDQAGKQAGPVGHSCKSREGSAACMQGVECMQGKWNGVQGKCTTRRRRDWCTHWPLSLGQPDIFGPAKGFRSRVGGWQEPVGLCSSCHPGWQQLSQGSAQLGDGVVKLGGGKGYK